MNKGRQQALAAYQRGALDEAIALQRRLVPERNVRRRPEIDDILLLCFFLHQRKQFTEAVAAFRDGLLLYPDAAPLHENLGVCLLRQGELPASVEALERALALGSASANVYDALCNALTRLGRSAEGLDYGRKSLELKDRRFGAAPPIASVPEAPPPPFDALKREQNVIAYALWGDSPRYLEPLMENLRMHRHLFPAWTIRVYLDSSVPENYRHQLERGGAQIRSMTQPPGEAPARRLLWRFEVISDPSIKRFLIRDADSFLTVKERVAVDDWLRSSKYFHLMRDFPTHTDLILAGLWGGVGGVLPPLQKLLQDFRPWRIENDHIDQDILSVTAWPTIRQSCLIHDRMFTGCLGSVPFPPYGDLPTGHHVGQNAFVHFRRSK